MTLQGNEDSGHMTSGEKENLVIVMTWFCMITLQAFHVHQEFILQKSSFKKKDVLVT